MPVTYIQRTFILIWFVVLLTSCENAQKGSENNNIDFSGKKSEKIILHFQPQKGSYIHFYYNNPVNEEKSFHLNVENDTNMFEEISNYEKGVMEVNFNKGGSPVRYLMFPGDTIEVKNIGRNRYKLLSKIDNRQAEIDFQYNNFYLIDGAFSLSLEDSYRENKIRFENNYISLSKTIKKLLDEKIVSEVFYEHISMHILSRYFTALLYPAYIPKKKSELDKVDDNFLKSILDKDKKYLSMFSYRNNLWNYLKYLCLKNYSFLSEENLYHTCLENFEGSEKDFLLARIINESIREGFPQNFDKDSFKEQISDPFYRNYVKLNSFEEDLKENTLFSLENKKTSLKELLEGYRDTMVFVDFWASWCVPCKEEMKYYPDLLEKYGFNKVEFVFLSLDKDISNWQSSVIDFDFMDEENSFILADDFDSKIAKKLNVNSIPRYVVFKNGKVIIPNSKRPSETEALVELLDSYLNLRNSDFNF